MSCFAPIKKPSICLFIFLANFALSASSQPEIPMTPPVAKPETWITVFVHGIMSIKPHLSLSNFIRFMTDDISNSVYCETVRLMREDPIYYQNQAMQEIGLKKIDPTDVRKGNAPAALANMFERVNAFVKDYAPLDNHYYTFGWSGLLSQKRRYLDAKKLYQALVEEVEHLRSQGLNPHIRLIGYSHGGNVLLNLARVRKNEPHYPHLTIDEIVLLGMPVQKETDYLICDPIFDRIYHIYSRGDRVQKLDFFSLKRFFSERLFKPRRGFELPEKLIQIQLKCTRNASFEYCHQPLRVDLYNFKNQSIVSGKSQYLRDASPGHAELWFFAWTPINYRRHFPLNPLPAAALIPLIIHQAGNFQEKTWFEKPTLIDIRPEQEIVLVRNQKSKKMLTITQFLPQEELARLSDKAMQFAPDNYTAELYEDGIRRAYQQAKKNRQVFVRKKRLTKRQNRKVSRTCVKVS